MFVYKNKHLSFFFFFFFAVFRRRPGVVRVRTSTQNTSMQKVKTNPYRYNFKVLASKMRFNWGREKQPKLRNQSTFSNGAKQTASAALTLLLLLFFFFFRLFDFNLFELKYTKKCTRIHQRND